MGKALAKGDIDPMNRAMSPGQIEKLDRAPQGVQLFEMPGLEIRYLVFNTEAPVGEGQGRTPGHRPAGRPQASSSPRSTATRPSRSTRWSRPPSPATPTRSSTSTATRTRAGRRPAADAGINTPVKLTLTTPPTTTVRHRRRSSRRSRPAQPQRPLRRQRPGHRWTDSAPAKQGRLTPPTAWAGSPTSRTPTTTSRRSSTRTTSWARRTPTATVQTSSSRHPGARPTAASPPRDLTEIQDIVADDVPSAAVAGQAVRRRARRHHRGGVGAQLLLRPAAVGARPRCRAADDTGYRPPGPGPRPGATRTRRRRHVREHA